MTRALTIRSICLAFDIVLSDFFALRILWLDEGRAILQRLTDIFDLQASRIVQPRPEQTRRVANTNLDVRVLRDPAAVPHSLLATSRNVDASCGVYL